MAVKLREDELPDAWRAHIDGPQTKEFHDYFPKAYHQSA